MSDELSRENGRPVAGATRCRRRRPDPRGARVNNVKDISIGIPVQMCSIVNSSMDHLG